MAGSSTRRIRHELPSQWRACRWVLRSRSTLSPERLPDGEFEVSPPAIDRDGIAHTHALIRPFIRRTPFIEIDADDVGLGDFRIVFKLELLQHAGSFKTRGAFANLLLRKVPEAA